MDAPRAPRQVDAPDATPSVEGRRELHTRALQASTLLHTPPGFVALVLLEVLSADTAQPDERVLADVTTRLAEVLNRRLRSVDLLVRSASCELAVLLTLAHIGVAAAFSERLRQPIEQALRGMGLADGILVGMGLAANPPAVAWHPDALIELADFRMRAAISRARQAPNRDWALFVDGAAVPHAWPDPLEWQAASHMTSDSGGP